MPDLTREELQSRISQALVVIATWENRLRTGLTADQVDGLRTGLEIIRQIKAQLQPPAPD